MALRIKLGVIAVLSTLLWPTLTTPVEAQGSSCSGTHCTFIANYLPLSGPVPPQLSPFALGVHTTMSMDTHAVPFGLSSSRICAPGDIFTVPIEAGGEIVGHAVNWYDSPPITFESGGMVRAETDGLPLFNSTFRYAPGFIHSGNLDTANVQHIGSVQQGNTNSTVIGDILGTWQDGWQTFSGPTLTPAVSCTTNPDGRAATCRINQPTTGSLRLQLTRTIDRLHLHPPSGGWQPSIYAYFTRISSSGGRTWENLPSRTFPIPPINDNSITGNMVSSVYLTCAAIPTPTPIPSPTPPPPPSPVPLSILGRVFHDVNGNAAFDPGESLVQARGAACTSSVLVPGVQIQATPSGGSAVGWTAVPNQCNPEAYYTSGPIQAGTYAVSVTVPGGWQVTTTVPVVSTVHPVAAPTRHVWFGIRQVPTPTPTPQNNPPLAVAGISINGAPTAQHVTINRGTPVSVALSAVGSSDPDGWTHPTLGVSAGGTCEWNSDLNQGNPTFEQTIGSPTAPVACGITLGQLTFNDTPGTYTYQVLRITDRPGAVSNSGAVSVTVVAPQCSDTIDNPDPEDLLADAADPGCHSDGNANNPQSYNPQDNDERNTASPLPTPTPSPAGGTPTPTLPIIQEIE